MVLSDGTSVEMDKYYAIVTNDFMATGGDNYNFTNALETMNTYIPVRDTMMEEVERAVVISPVKQNWLSEAGIPEIYVVVSGDSIWKIAQKFGTTIEKVIDLNEINQYKVYFNRTGANYSCGIIM